jgi:hypothetical protein
MYSGVLVQRDPALPYSCIINMKNFTEKRKQICEFFPTMFLLFLITRKMFAVCVSNFNTTDRQKLILPVKKNYFNFFYF